jgi:hypothetical protein
MTGSQPLRTLKTLMYKYMLSDYEITKNDYQEIVEAVYILEKQEDDTEFLKHLDDIEYMRNKLFSMLGVPKELLEDHSNKK